jgi:hypothetical protein
MSVLPGHAAEKEYGYPIPGSYEATVLGTPASLKAEFPAYVPTRQLVLTIFPKRVKPAIFFYDEGLRCTFAYQKTKAPLVFLIAGTGGSNKASNLIATMKALHHAGFHVITVPSPTNANFIISASQSSIPGDLTEDAADLYRVMEIAWNQVKGDIEISSFYLGGFSLGALQSAFVAKLDEERKIFNFQKVLMVNPPVSFYNSATRIEELLKQIPGGPNKQGIFFNKMFSKLSEFHHHGNFVVVNDDFLYAIYTEKLFSKAETAGLIGLTFRVNLAGMIFSSDVMTNSGYVVPKNRELSSSDPLFDYFLVSSHLSYFDYFNEYLFPYVQTRRPGLTREGFINSLTMMNIEGYLKSSPKFGVMTNANDFILTGSERDYLRELFGKRAKIYPRGGHMGNLEYKENMADLVDFFKSSGE